MKRTAQNKEKTPVGEYGYPTPDIAALSAKALEVTRILTEFYGRAEWSKKDPLSMLMEIILSHRTRDEQTAEAYDNLKKRFKTWAELRDAPTSEVEETIANVNWPEVKAPRLQALLRRITEERGELSLDFLRDIPVEEGAEWLGHMEGVGPKTRACVLLFSCRKPILPVDTHVHRVAIRLGLIGKKVSADAAHTLLLNLLPPDSQVIYDFHKGLLRHGQRMCFYSHPRCEICPLTELCVYYKTVMRPKITGQPSSSHSPDE